MKRSYKKSIAIDFDGTIVTEAYPKIGKLKPGAKKYINKLYKKYLVTINTCRSGLFEADAINFLKEHKINYHYINSNDPAKILSFKSDCRKISADVYVDDKCLFNLPSWKNIYKLTIKKLNKIKW